MNADELLLGSAAEMAAAVRSGDISASTLVHASLARICDTDKAVNAFTDVIAQRALQAASALDGRLAVGDTTAKNLPLCGVPFAVKNLFDVAGLTTLAGSKIERGQPAAALPGRR